MDAEQAGRVTAFVLIVFVIPVGIYLFGHVRSRGYERGPRAKTRRRFAISAIITFAILGVAAVVGNIGNLARNNAEMFRAGIERGCNKGCLRRTGKPEPCKKLCGCVAKEFTAGFGKERIGTIRSASDFTATDRIRMRAVALQCRRKIPNAK